MVFSVLIEEFLCIHTFVRYTQLCIFVLMFEIMLMLVMITAIKL